MKKILLGLFIFGFLVLGSQAHASVLSDALLRIDSLTKELAQLKAKLGAAVLHADPSPISDIVNDSIPSLPAIPSLSLPVVLGPNASNITATSATISATITYLGNPAATAGGMCYDQTSGTTGCNTAGISLGTISRNLTGLTPNTRYYYTGQAVSTLGTALSSVGTSFTTLSTTAPSATISATNCSILSGASNCISSIKWQLTNPSNSSYKVITSNSNNSISAVETVGTGIQVL